MRSVQNRTNLPATLVSSKRLPLDFGRCGNYPDLEL